MNYNVQSDLRHFTLAKAGRDRKAGSPLVIPSGLSVQAGISDTTLQRTVFTASALESSLPEWLAKLDWITTKRAQGRADQTVLLALGVEGSLVPDLDSHECN